MFVVFDIDGTIADGTHKRSLLKPPGPDGVWPEQDWDAWIEASINDTAIEPILEVALSMIDAGHKVEFWTGRSEVMRDVTERWLATQGLAGHHVEMRPNDPESETMPDDLAKARYLMRRGVPDLIFEDKSSVVKMWRRFGIIVAQVADYHSEREAARAGGTVEKAA